ncbi:MAG TPA: PEP-CTERM sorting domain-containing protein [Bryobacteraceae bacterium]
MARKLLMPIVLGVLVLAVGALPSRADEYYYPSLSVNLDVCNNQGEGGCYPGGNDPTIFDPAIFVAGLAAPGHFPPDGVFSGESFNFFTDGEYSGPVPPTFHGAVVSGFQPTGIMMAGRLDYLPSDGDTPTDHVVLWVDSTAASGIVGESWDSVFNSDPGFGGYDESTILSDLQVVDEQDPDTDPDYFNSVYDLDGFFQSNLSLLGNADGGSLTAVAFSDGSVVGTAVASVDVVSDTPEPGTLLSLLLGAGAIALFKRKHL